MPDVIDYSIRNARVMLESVGLKVGDLIYVPSEYTNLVLGQHYKGKPIKAGTLLERGATIDILIGKGLSNQTTVIPDLIGLNLHESKKICQDLFLNIGAKIYDTTIISKEDTLNAFIWKQRPMKNNNTRLRLGSSIDIWLTTDSLFITSDSTAVDSTNIQQDEKQDEVEKENFF
jgi:beta-lactam-binding protein with PASTA domain